MESPRPLPVLLLSVCRGQGSGAESVLAALLEAGHTSLPEFVTVQAPRESGVHEAATAFGYRTRVWPAWGASALPADWSAALAALRPARGGILHAWHMRSFDVAATASALFGSVLAVTMHDSPRQNPYSPLRRHLARWGAHRAAAVVCVSEALRDECLDSGWHAPFRVIRNGLPERDIPARKTGALLRVAFLGSHVAWKGGDLVAGLAAEAAAGGFQLDLYGDLTPGSAPELRRLAEAPPPAVRFHGRKAVEQILADADVVLHPSQSFDPYPTVLLEAARHGVPVLASPAGGSAEIVEDGVTGLIVSEPSRAAWNAALLALRDPLRRETLGAAARRRFENRFRAATMVQAYADLWRALPTALVRPRP